MTLRPPIGYQALRITVRSASVIAEEQPVWRFGERYRAQQLFRDPETVRRFIDDFLRHEAEFFAQARHRESGLTYDGWNLCPETREPVFRRPISAASKECLDLAILIKGLYGDPIVSQVISPDDLEQAEHISAAILERKLKSYQRYQADFPGFSGLFTWFESGETMRPAPGWEDRLPTLDLGEMLWSLLLVEKALRDSGRDDLAEGYGKLNQHFRTLAKEALIEPKSGRARGHVQVSNPQSPQSQFSGTDTIKGEHGVHESQMILMYLYLFADLTAEERERLWSEIVPLRIEHQFGTTWQGYWGSAHEEWAFLFLPYFDHSGWRDLFRIRQKIRCANASAREYPGFASSAHHPKEDLYMSAAGIEGVGSQALEYQDTFTPYGAYPVLLEFAPVTSQNPGLVWLHSMLKQPGMQGPFGAGESGRNDGSASAPVKTIDVSFTVILALAGGLQAETAELLRETGRYDLFMNRLGRLYESGFGTERLREPVDFLLPE